MKKLLNEISVIPGVTGACIFDKKDGPVYRDSQPTSLEEGLQTVGIHFLRLIQMGNMADLPIQTSHFRFDKYTVIGMPLGSGAVLLTLCESQANCSLVATTAAMLAADMQEELGRDGITAINDTDHEEPATEPEEDDDADMQFLYDEIEHALAGAIGPVAGVVMQDYLKKWKKEGPVIPFRLGELAKMLEEEIGDSELAKDFSAKIQTIL